MMQLRKFSVIDWALFGAAAGAVNFAFHYILVKVIGLNFTTVLQSSAQARLLNLTSLDFMSFFALTIIFWAVIALIGKFTFSFFTGGLKIDFLNLFIPLLIGRLAVILFAYPFSAMLWLITAVYIGILILLVDLVIYGPLNRRLPA